MNKLDQVVEQIVQAKVRQDAKKRLSAKHTQALKHLTKFLDSKRFDSILKKAIESEVNAMFEDNSIYDSLGKKAYNKFMKKISNAVIRSLK